MRDQRFVRRWLFMLVCATGVSTAHGQQWTDVTPTSMRLESLNCRGSAWGDYDNDGDDDVYVTSWGIGNRLYRNDGGGMFVDVTQAPLNVPGQSYSGRAVWGDYDNDGDLDLYVAQSLQSFLLRNDRSDGFVNIALSNPLAMFGRLTRTAAWGDYDGDGLLDLYVGAHVGAANASHLMHNDGDGAFSDTTWVHIDGDAGIGRGVAFVDYDGDGDADIYVANGDSPDGALMPEERINGLYRNDGGTFVNVTTPPIDAPTHGRGIAWGDYDNDGDQDLYSCAIYVGVGACCIDDEGVPVCEEVTKYNCEQFLDGVYLGDGVPCDEAECGEGGGKPGVDNGNGENQLFRNDGNGVFTDVTTEATGFDGVTRCGSWVDFDNDGDLDLYQVNSYALSKLLRNDGDGVFVDVATGPIAGEPNDNAQGASWADFDGDGDLDVLVTMGPGDGNHLIRNDLDGGNHWIQVKLVGTLSNRSGIGARVTVTAGGSTQTREIRSGEGYFVQHQLAAHFGLGAATVIDALTITWPAGGTTNLKSVAVDQHLLLIEPCNPGVDCIDCNDNGEPDIGDLVLGSSPDCNENDVPDECDIASGESTDLDGNDVPDDCEDCNGNGIPDSLDLADGTSSDCNENGIPDECDYDVIFADCNGNGTLDLCEIDQDPELDQDGDGVIDSCSDIGDVNGDGVVDVQDLITLLLNWGPCEPTGDPCLGDVNSDGSVDVSDLVIVILNWGPAG